MSTHFHYFKSSSEIIRHAMMMYVRVPLSLRNVEDLLHERDIDVCHGTIRYWWNRFGPVFASEIRKRRIRDGWHSNWRWYLDEAFVKITGQRHYLWRAVDHQGVVPDAIVTKKRDKKSVLNILKRLMKLYGTPVEVVTVDSLPAKRHCVRWAWLIFSQSAAGRTTGPRTRTLYPDEPGEA